MVPNYELFLHGFNAMAAAPETAPLPLWMKLGLGSLVSAPTLLSFVVR